jgi:hypothetical protein
VNPRHTLAATSVLSALERRIASLPGSQTEPAVRLDLSNEKSSPSRIQIFEKPSLICTRSQISFIKSILKDDL